MTTKEKEEKAPGRPHVFALGFVFLAMAGFQIKISGHNYLTSLYLLLGAYNIWQEGYHKDASSWKIKPSLILVLFVAMWGALIYGVVSREESQKKKNTKIVIPYIEQLSLQYNKELPRVFSGLDSLMTVKVHDSNTLEFFYKINEVTLNKYAKSKESCVEEIRSVLRNQFESTKKQIKRRYLEEGIHFCHRFLDEKGEALFTINIDPSDF